MESGFLAFILFHFFAGHSSQFGFTEWDDVVVTKKDMPTTLVCTDTTMKGPVAIEWSTKSPDARDWKMVYTADENMMFSGGSSKTFMQLEDSNFYNTGIFSLSFHPKITDSGLYLCTVKQQEGKRMERIILLAILAVSVIPTPPIPQYSILQLIASVNPSIGVSKIIWVTPAGTHMKSEKILKTGTVAKLPMIQITDSGAYVCIVHPGGNSTRKFFAFNVNVSVSAGKVVSFNDTKHGPMISTAIQAQTPISLTCPNVQGDYVNLFWKKAENSKQAMKLIYQYDRWRDKILVGGNTKSLQLAGPPYNAKAGSFSFLITPKVNEGGLYICDVFLNNGTFSQRTTLSVMKEIPNVTPSPLPSLSALLLLVPLFAAAVGVLLWRQKYISDRGIEQSLSVHSGEAENIYENPEDIRQTPPQGSVYMDLKPREEDDVYKELE
ncbi:g6f-like isoform X1 [Echeneis naucrates]|uniref:g6f-like isoform X1 n=1 Tax=Echeneis naucrates TaxID=173247 RepID=UPI0011143205|nr:hemicentin-1-like isoform X1 [Echeneis naucrates]